MPPSLLSSPGRYLKFCLLLLVTVCFLVPAADAGVCNAAVTTGNRKGALFSGFTAHHRLSRDRSIQWYHVDCGQQPEAVALVIHGLNLKPSKMESIISGLTASKIEVSALSLRGHGQNYIDDGRSEPAEARLQTFKQVSYADWYAETLHAAASVTKSAQQKKIPSVFVGFSLGGLIGLDVFATAPDVHFDKMVLLAPSIDLHDILNLARAMRPFPKMVIPSLTPKSYLANRGTPMAGYNALFDCLDHFKANLSSKINIPTLVFVDRQDELISFSGMKELVRKNGWDRWKFQVIQKGEEAGWNVSHHLIVDEFAVGSQIFREMMDAAIKHILAPQQAFCK
jgi:alpha-beta hydrolase superfamily lysophospholipase